MNNSTYLESVKDKAVKDGLLSEEFVDFYTSLFKLQEQYSERFKELQLEHKFLQTKSLPVIKTGTISFPAEDKKLLTEMLEKLTVIIEQYQSGISLETLKERYASNWKAVESLVKGLISSNTDVFMKEAEECKLGADELAFVVINWFKPYMIALREMNEPKIDYRDYDSPHCPFCGFLSDMSKIIEVKENVRLLHCGLCEHEWAFRRMACTICENKEPDKLGYYFMEEDKIHRFDYCDSCKGYIKTVRVTKEHEASSFNMTVENILTAYLDASALDMGYNRP